MELLPQVKRQIFARNYIVFVPLLGTMHIEDIHATLEAQPTAQDKSILMNPLSLS